MTRTRSGRPSASASSDARVQVRGHSMRLLAPRPDIPDSTLTPSCPTRITSLNRLRCMDTDSAHASAPSSKPANGNTGQKPNQVQIPAHPMVANVARAMKIHAPRVLNDPLGISTNWISGAEACVSCTEALESGRLAILGDATYPLQKESVALLSPSPLQSAPDVSQISLARPNPPQ